MLESNTQGHGTIKKLRTGAVVSTLALTAFGVSTVVSASETEVAVNEPATRVVAKDEVVPKVPSQSDVEKAKAESDKASQDVAKQKEVVTSTETKIADAEKTIADTTKKVDEAKSVTPEKVAEAKADADKKANELATAEKTVADADKSVSATAEKVANAQKKVDALSSTTDVVPLEKEVDALTDQVKNDTQSVKDAKANLDSAKKAETDKEQAIKDARTGVSTAHDAFRQATTDLVNAKKDKTLKENAVKQAKSALDVAKQGVTETTTSSETMYTVPKATYAPALSQGYINSIKALANGTGTTDAVDTAVYEVPYSDPKSGTSADSLSDFNSTGTRTEKGKEIPYGAEDTDDTEIADFQHLTKDQQIKLAIYAASIINELRAKFGTKPVTVGDTSLKLAEAFNNNANGYISANSGEYNPLNTQDLTLNDKLNMAKESTEVISSSLGIRSKMIPDFLGLGKTVSTMAHVKQVMYQGIVNALMGVNETTSGTDSYAAALSLLGLRDEDKTNLGVGIGYMGSYTTKGYEASITLSTPQDTVTTTQKVDPKAVETAQKSYDSALSELEQAKSKVNSLQTDFSNADKALLHARERLASLLATNKQDIPALEKALADAQTKLDNDSKALQTAKESLALAKSNATDKAKALADAKSALKIAKAEQETADKALATAKGELEVLTKAHDVAVLARKSAGQDLARKREASKEATDTYEVLALSLTHRDEVLKALDKELADAKANLGVLRAELETAKDELTRLEGIAEVKARGYENFKQLKADHDAYLAEQQRLQALKDKTDAIRKAGGQPKEVLDDNGKVVDIVDGKAQDKAVVATVGTKDDKTYQAPAQARNAKAEPKKQLPNTGTKESGLLALLGASVGLLALAGKRKYNR